jgi:LPXTG-motif cell wall-anchored protein
MPLLDHPAAFPVVVGVMVAVALGLFILFRRRGWL